MDRLVGEGVVVGHPVQVVDDQCPHLLLSREEEAVDDNVNWEEGRREGGRGNEENEMIHMLQKELRSRLPHPPLPPASTRGMTKGRRDKTHR